MEKSSINGALNGKIDYGGFPIAMIDYRKLQVDLGLYYNSVIYDIYIYIWDIDSCIGVIPSGNLT